MVDALEKVLLKVVNGKMVKGVYEDQLEALVYRDYFGDMPVVEKVTLDGCVYPSEEKTIRVVYDETYGGAHCYIMRECLGFADPAINFIDAPVPFQGDKPHNILFRIHLFHKSTILN